ncbi:MAG: monovalent cation/H+ antiporter subunit D [Kiloniellaceae bacterium]
MNHWIVVPVVLPALMAPFIVLAMRHDLVLQRVFSAVASVALLGVAIGLLSQAASAPPQLYQLGNWAAPFGIVLVLDRLSALMVLLTAILAVVVVIYAITSGWDSRGRHFHALFQFQLMGINGAFLTGDVFNLFVFFEVLLIASYGLMLHGGGAARMKAGVKYVVVNLGGSTLFLIAVGTLYGITGTLNMADLAVKVPLVPEGDQALLRVGALLLLLVFAVKAALVPVHFWLPGTYANASAPVAALFAIMTKVGAYSIIRVYTLAFGAGAGEDAWLAADWLLPAALVTLVVGVVGVLGAKELTRLVCFSVISSMGTLLTAIALFTPAATTAALFYLIHSTFAGAALFLLADLIKERRGSAEGRLIVAPRFAQTGLLAVMFFLAAIGMAGMPPLTGFLGKLMVLDSARDADSMVTIWTLILVTSLLAMIGFSRAGSLIFWKSAAIPGPQDPAAATRPVLPIAAAGVMLAGMVGLAIFAGPVTGYLEATSAGLHDPVDYIRAVLGPDVTAAK